MPKAKIETHLWEVRGNDGSVRELPPRQRPQRLRRGLVCLELDVDLADAGRLPAAADGPRDNNLGNVAVFGAFFVDVLFDF
jgi:hypothetical protein